MEQTTETAVIATPDELSGTLACSAYAGTSFTPEKRGRRTQEGFAEEVNGFYAEMLALCTNDAQRELLSAEILRYKANYLRHYTAYLSSSSRCVSSFIAGPSNFPVQRMQKRNDIAHRRLNDFIEWQEKAKKSVREKILDARTDEEKEGSAWGRLSRDIRGSLGTIKSIDEDGAYWTRSAFVNSIAGKVERLAANGEAGLVIKAMELVAEYNAAHKKPAISKNHKFWSFGEIAKAKAAALASPASEGETLYQGEGVRVVTNPEIDRVQIFFDAIPPAELRGRLKGAGWNWSPREAAWQRKLTSAAKHSGVTIAGG
jgi:hypothetical protein